MQISQNSHSPPLAMKKQHLKLHIQPIHLPDANVLNKTLGNSEPDVGGKIIKTERMTGYKQNKKFQIKQLLPNAHFRQQTNQSKITHQENECLSIILYKQAQTTTNDKVVTRQLVSELKTKLEQQETIIRLQEFKINRLQQELQSQKTICSNLILKVNSLDPKYNAQNFMKITKQSPLGFDTLFPSSLQPSIAKISNNSDQNKFKALQQELRQFKAKNNELSCIIKEAFIQLSKILQHKESEWLQKLAVLSNQYQLKITGLEELLKVNNIFQEESLSKIYTKCEILAQELLLSENQKDVIYQKCLQLLE